MAAEFLLAKASYKTMAEREEKQDEDEADMQEVTTINTDINYLLG